MAQPESMATSAAILKKKSLSAMSLSLKTGKERTRALVMKPPVARERYLWRIAALRPPWAAAWA